MKKLFAISILVLGLGVIVYGWLNPPLANKAEVESKYCPAEGQPFVLDGAESQAQLGYCLEPWTAPEASLAHINLHTYAGVAIIVISVGYFRLLKITTEREPVASD